MRSDIGLSHTIVGGLSTIGAGGEVKVNWQVKEDAILILYLMLKDVKVKVNIG